MSERNDEVPQDKRIEFCIGIHQSNIIVDGGDTFGDGVNVAVRREAVPANRIRYEIPSADGSC